MKNEIWKDIYFIENGVEYDYRGLYQVSNKGNVKSLNYHRTGKEKILKFDKSHNGYLCVVLCKDIKKRFRVNRLVAHMFCDGYEDGLVPDHINTIRTDNRAENLIWKTRKENNNNPLTKENYSKAKKGENHPMLGLLIERWSKDGKLLDIKYQFEYVKMGFNSGHISSCCRGKYKSHKGFIFKYHEDD